MLKIETILPKISIVNNLFYNSFSSKELEDEYSVEISDNCKSTNLLYDIILLIILLYYLLFEVLVPADYQLVENLTYIDISKHIQQRVIMTCSIGIAIHVLLVIISMKSKRVRSRKLLHMAKWITMLSFYMCVAFIKMDIMNDMDRISLLFAMVILLSVSYLCMAESNLFLFSLNLFFQLLIIMLLIAKKDFQVHFIVVIIFSVILNIFACVIKYREEELFRGFFKMRKNYQSYFEYMDKMVDTMNVKMITIKDGQLIYLNKLQMFDLLDEKDCGDLISVNKSSNHLKSRTDAMGEYAQFKRSPSSLGNLVSSDRLLNGLVKKESYLGEICFNIFGRKRMIDIYANNIKSNKENSTRHLPDSPSKKPILKPNTMKENKTMSFRATPLVVKEITREDRRTEELSTKKRLEKKSNTAKNVDANAEEFLHYTTLQDYLNLIRDDRRLVNEDFTILGTFLNTSDDRKAYEVHYRKNIIEGSNIIDCMFFDVSKILNAERESLGIKMKENEQKIKAKFFSKIVHEFKTPLNSIVSIVNQIKDTKFNAHPQLIEYLNQVDGLSNYTVFLISDIINYANDFKSLSFNLQECWVKCNLEFTYEILKALLYTSKSKQKNIKPFLRFNLKDDIAIKADQYRLRQILLNFVSNSVKFTKKGFIEISSGLTPDKHLYISVKDTGSGIKEEDKSKLFKEFSMLETHKNNNPEGTGLGLSICGVLADNMNFKLSFDSKENEGSTFTLTTTYVLDLIDLETVQLKPKPTTRTNHFRLSPEKPNDKIEESTTCSNFGQVLLGRVRTEKKPQSQITKTSSHGELTKSQTAEIRRLKNTISKTHLISQMNVNTLICPELILEDEEKPRRSDFEENSVVTRVIEDNPINLNTFIEAKTKLLNSNTDFIEDKEKESCDSKCIFNSMSLSKVVEDKIIVADDNSLIRSTLSKQIYKVVKELGRSYSIVEVSDGIEILYELMKDLDNSVKFVFTDECMEYLNGSRAIALLKEFSREQRIGNVCCVSVTGFDDLASKQKILDLGADHIVSKPPSREDLLKIFERS